MELFGVGLPEAGLVFVLALILIGPERFPEMARQAGRWYRTARNFTDAVMVDVRSAVDEIEEEIADKNDGLRPIRELQEIRREFTQIGENTVAAAGDDATRVALEGAMTEASSAGVLTREAPADGAPAEGAPATTATTAPTGTGGV